MHRALLYTTNENQKLKTMKQLTRIFQALLGAAAMILTALVAFGRLTWRCVKGWWRNRPKWLRRSIATIVVIFLAGFVALIVRDFYNDIFGRWYWNDKYLSDNVMIRSFHGCKYRVYNLSTGKYTTPRVNWVSDMPDNDSLAVYAVPNKRGYINAYTGEIVINAEKNDYSKAWVFSDGLAAVMKNGKIGFINAENEVVIPFRFDYSDKCYTQGFGYLFHNGYGLMTNKEGDLGLIDRSGNWVVEPAYDEIWTPHESGYRIIVDDGRHGLLDSLCNVVYPAEYGHIDILSDGLVLAEGGKMWKEDFEGNIIEPFMFDGTYYLNYPTGYNDCGDIEYVFADYLKYKVMNLYGIMNRITGKPVTPALYCDVNMLSKDLFEVQDPESCDWHLIDTNGNEVSR